MPSSIHASGDSDADLRRLFDVVDKNHDGIIHAREMLLGLRKQPRLATLLHLPARIRQDGDGSREQFEYVFQRMMEGGDRDRGITFVQFKRYIDQNRDAQPPSLPASFLPSPSLVKRKHHRRTSSGLGDLPADVPKSEKAVRFIFLAYSDPVSVAAAPGLPAVVRISTVAANNASLRFRKLKRKKKYTL